MLLPEVYKKEATHTHTRTGECIPCTRITVFKRSKSQSSMLSHFNCPSATLCFNRHYFQWYAKPFFYSCEFTRTYIPVYLWTAGILHGSNQSVVHRSRDTTTDHKCLNVKCGTFDQKTNKMGGGGETMFIITLSLNITYLDCDLVFAMFLLFRDLCFISIIYLWMCLILWLYSLIYIF